jgi:hypothetical protein
VGSSTIGASDDAEHDQQEGRPEKRISALQAARAILNELRARLGRDDDDRTLVAERLERAFLTKRSIVLMLIHEEPPHLPALCRATVGA